MNGKKKVITAVCIGIAVMTGLICISCNKIPGWVTWEKRQIKDATGEYEVTLSSRAVSVSRSSDQKISMIVLFWCNILQYVEYNGQDIDQQKRTG